MESRVGIGNFGKVGVSVGYFTSDSATLVTTACHLNDGLSPFRKFDGRKCFIRKKVFFSNTSNFRPQRTFVWSALCYHPEFIER